MKNIHITKEQEFAQTQRYESTNHIFSSAEQQNYPPTSYDI
ncbi:hypothetical protein [Chitinophaga skermanii]|nr:hypothetical protein [Chitinophaga skermanii]